MKNYEEFDEIITAVKKVNDIKKILKSKSENDISEMELFTDKVVKEIFKVNTIIDIDNEIFENAYRRHLLRNPPGKKDSMGDAVNWEILLKYVPDGEDLHIISHDGDFYSNIDEESINPFLNEEWKNKKSSNIFCYRNMSKFTKKHYNGLCFSFDSDKENLLLDLFTSENFARTHIIINKLDNYSHYSLREVIMILNACMENSQFGWIITDDDICKFMKRVVCPRKNEITNKDFLDVIDKINECHSSL